jgi:hypothetical protein
MKSHLLALLSLALPAFAADDTYELHFQRSCKAGDTLTVAAKVSVDDISTATADNNLVGQEREEFTGTLGGKMEVLTVNAQGVPTALKLRVTETTFKKAGAAEAPIKVGDTVEVSAGAGGKETIKVNGTDATPEQKTFVEAFELTSGDLMPDGKQVNKGQKMKVGESVPATGEMAAAIIENGPVKGMKPQDVKGACRLVEVRDVDGQKCLNFAMDTSITGGGMPLPNQKDFTVKSITMETFFEGDYPIDPAVQPPRRKRSVLIELSATGLVEHSGEKIQVTYSTHGKHVRELQVRPGK